VQVVLTLTENSTYEHYLYVALGTIGVYSLLFLLTVLVSCYEFRYGYHRFEELEGGRQGHHREAVKRLVGRTVRGIETLARIAGTGEEAGEADLVSVTQRLSKVVRQLSSKEADGGQNTEPGDATDLFLGLDQLDNVEAEDRCKVNKDLFIELEQLDGLGVEVEDRYKVRLKKDLKLSDVSLKLKDRTERKSRFRKTDMYWQCGLIISIYYSIPTIQMVLDTNAEYDSTGNHDLCYFNLACTMPLGKLKDFGSTFSNLGYVVLGLLFISLVFLKTKRFNDIQIAYPRFDPNMYGVPQQTGVYYAMGAALMMEGVMSTVYHVCPTTLAFQFDTTYMYLIAILMFVKLFQGRHPDLSLDAFQAYLGLGVALILEALSFYCNGLPYWIVFCTVYMIFVIIICVVAYSLGTIKKDHLLLWSVIKVVFTELQGTAVVAAGGDDGKCHAPVFRAR
jgi:hypothetical protein